MWKVSGWICLTHRRVFSITWKKLAFMNEFLRNKTNLINLNLFETNQRTSMHKKNSRSPSFQPCSSNKNPGPIIQFQPVPTEGAQFHLPRTHGLQFRELQFLQRCERWMDGWLSPPFFKCDQWQSGDFWWKITRVSGFQQKC